MRAALLALLAVPLAAAVYVPAPWSTTPEEAVVRPGAFITSPRACTVGFLYVSAVPGDATRYASSAGHCFDAVGEPVRVGTTVVGTVAWRHGDEDVNNKPDFALIKLHADVPAHPRVVTWGGPCEDPHAVALADEVGLYGNGAGTGETFGGPSTLKNSRSGHVTYLDAKRFGTDVVIAEGDSGGPVVHKATKTPVGIVEQYGPYAPQVGPRVPWIASTLAAANVHVAMAYDPNC